MNNLLQKQRQLSLKIIICSLNINKYINKDIIELIVNQIMNKNFDQIITVIFIDFTINCIQII